MKFKLQYRVHLLVSLVLGSSSLMWALGNREHCSRITMAVPENLLLSHQTKELNNHPVLFHICVTIRIQSKQVFMHVFKFMLFDTLESLVCVECFDCGCSTKWLSHDSSSVQLESSSELTPVKLFSHHVDHLSSLTEQLQYVQNFPNLICSLSNLQNKMSFSFQLLYCFCITDPVTIATVPVVSLTQDQFFHLHHKQLLSTHPHTHQVLLVWVSFSQWYLQSGLYAPHKPWRSREMQGHSWELCSPFEYHCIHEKTLPLATCRMTHDQKLLYYWSVESHTVLDLEHLIMYNNSWIIKSFNELDPYKLWRMLQVYRKNDQVYRNSYGSCSLLKLPQSSFCVHLRLAKGSKSCICLLTATCWLVLDGYPILLVHFGAVTASLHIIEWS